jgi:parvulin-like peptidyl-prolyl isomerase
VKTDFGYHIIKVNEKTSRAYKLRDLKFDVNVSNQTRNLLRRKAADFRTQLAEGGSIDSLAARMKLQVFESGAIEKNQPAGGTIQLTNFAFNANQGEASDVIQLQDGSLLVAQVTKVRKAGTMDFTDARQAIIDKLRTRKKLELLKPRAEKMRAALASGDSLSAVRTVEPSAEVTPFADVARSAPVPGVGFDYPLTSAIFATQQGEISGLIRGERGYYIVRVDRLTQPTDQEFLAERAKFTQDLITQRRQQKYQEWLRKSREKAQIEDYRSGSGS